MKIIGMDDKTISQVIFIGGESIIKNLYSIFYVTIEEDEFLLLQDLALKYELSEDDFLELIFDFLIEKNNIDLHNFIDESWDITLNFLNSIVNDIYKYNKIFKDSNTEEEALAKISKDVDKSLLKIKKEVLDILKI